LHRSRFDGEIETELQFHVESYASDLMRNGVERDEATRRARLELGTLASQKEECRGAMGVRPWDDLGSDLRYAFRQMRSSPGFALTVVLVLGLGIGANAAMFSVVDATLLRWLPFSRPGEIVSLSPLHAKGDPAFATYADFEEWHRQGRSLSSVACYVRGSVYLKAPAGDQMVLAPSVSADFFSVLGTSPAIGRGFLPEEQLPGKGKVVVLSDPIWRTIFGSDPEILGKQVTVNDVPYTVVGVMPPRFAFPIDDPAAQVWVPIEATPNHHLRNFTTPPCQVIGRMGSGAGLPGVRSELSAIQQRLVPLYGGANPGDFAPSRVEATPYRDTLVRDARPALRALMLAVAIIWLIACANVANLMLARGMARQREIAVRGALGASRWRLMRQLLTESLVLSMGGAIAGLGLAQAALLFFDKALGARLNLPEHLAPNPTVLAALLGLSVLSALVFGLLPAWLAARTPIEHAMRQGRQQAGTGRKRHRLQQAMVVAEIGLSLVLLIASGLLLRTVFALRKVPLGFRTDHVLMVQPKVPRYKYRGQDLNRAVYSPLLERVKQMNGVRSTSLTTILPLNRGFDSMITPVRKPGRTQHGAAHAYRCQAARCWPGVAGGPGLQDVPGTLLQLAGYPGFRASGGGEPGLCSPLCARGKHHWPAQA
jgi:predicted permease